jgi:hypothetical protein
MRKIFTKVVFVILISLSNYAQTPTTGSFYPMPGGKYLVSGWVKEDSPEQVLRYSSTITIAFYEGNDLQSLPSYTFGTSGVIIDGWQRIIGIIEIPTTYKDPAISISLDCKAVGSTDCYFDDIRFFPYNGNLKSFVYDEETKKLMAELDENNYATFYEYDLEGGLVRVKKETERGVFTIQETRSGNVIKAGN